MSSDEVVVVAGGGEDAAVDAVVAELGAGLLVLGDEPVALADRASSSQSSWYLLVDRLIGSMLGCLQLLVGVADDDRDLEVVRLVARPEVDVSRSPVAFFLSASSSTSPARPSARRSS